MNRKGFDETLEKTVSKPTGNLCVLIIDIDHFIKFNDMHGHIVGDEVLKFVAKKYPEKRQRKRYSCTHRRRGICRDTPEYSTSGRCDCY